MVVTAIGGAAAANFGDPLENVLSLLGTPTTRCCRKDSARNAAGDQGPPRLLFLLLFEFSPFDDELRGRNMVNFRSGSNYINYTYLYVCLRRIRFLLP